MVSQTVDHSNYNNFHVTNAIINHPKLLLKIKQLNLSQRIQNIIIFLRLDTSHGRLFKKLNLQINRVQFYFIYTSTMGI